MCNTATWCRGRAGVGLGVGVAGARVGLRARVRYMLTFVARIIICERHGLGYCTRQSLDARQG